MSEFDFAELESLIDTMPQRGIPGCGIIVTADGDTVYRRFAGYSDHESTKKTSEEDIYWIFSASKVITCIAAMRLVEEGKLSLSDPVSKYLPEFGELTVTDPVTHEIRPCRTEMTVFHLFTMTGGLDYDLSAPPIQDAVKKGGGTVNIVRAMAKSPLHFEPGERYMYSLCHDVLAAVVEVVSGMRFGEYLKKIMFSPLGMNDTGFSPNEEQQSRIAAKYHYSHGRGIAIPEAPGNRYFLMPDYESGGAGIFCTADDYAKLMNVLSVGGTTKDGYRLLKPETIAELEVNRLHDRALNDFVVGRFFGYGWGLCGRVHMNPVYSLSPSSIGEFGWDGAAASYGLVDRKKGVSYFFATHVHGCTYAYHYLHPIIRNTVYKALGR